MGNQFFTPNFNSHEFQSPDVDSIPAIEFENLQKLCVHVLQPLREYMKTSIRVTSGYRTPAHNKAVGGVPTSDHVKGYAADIITTDNKKAFSWIKENCQFKQLINEKNLTWIHVSYDENNLKNEVLFL